MQNKIFGITGGSGTGKSYVAGLFKDMGAYVIDVDKLGHSVLENEAYNDIMAHFGTTKRSDIGKIVFGDPNMLQILNEIMQGHITKKVYIQVADAIAHHEIIVVDAAILTELNLHLICDLVILVTASREQRINRIIKRDGITKEQAIKRIDSQNIFAPTAAVTIQNG